MVSTKNAGIQQGFVYFLPVSPCHRLVAKIFPDAESTGSPTSPSIHPPPHLQQQLQADTQLEMISAPQREFPLLFLVLMSRILTIARGQCHGQGPEPSKYEHRSDTPPWGREHASTSNWSVRDRFQKCHITISGLFHPKPPHHSLQGRQPFERQSNPRKPDQVGATPLRTPMRENFSINPDNELSLMSQTPHKNRL